MSVQTILPSAKKLMLLLALAGTQLQAQDLAHYKRVIKEISSAKYQGRGYAKGGANKTGKYLQKEYTKAGVDEVILQPFTIDINTFCGKMEMWADGKKLKAGVDFSMREYSPGVRGQFPVYHVDTLNFDADKMYADLKKPEYANALVCCDFWFSYHHREAFSPLQKNGECNNAGLLQTWTSPIKFYKAYGERVVEKPIIWVTPEAIKDVKHVRMNVDNQFLKDYELPRWRVSGTTAAMSSRRITTTWATWVKRFSMQVPTIMPPAQQLSSH